MNTTHQTISDAVVVSTNYWIAPEYSFSVGNEDYYNLDQARSALSGSSAGGNFAPAVPFRPCKELDKRKS
ncbi:hypothetical protein N7474_002781 [Penicillium riverlandense]|uniref:uncharacterized protein n=1 Tax=Penicillium riverlandense TaxID=1903569 RepID=UPI002546E2DE|nr:uncharacterized protein N7474_002781 [Penicillium riverlandense]KAJ5825643.1 hypothetical protein N7474_002781 [Penicillium riverlandense]